MASDTKTPVEVARELTKALGEKIDALQKMELPKTPEKADGGQMASGSVPAVAKQAGGTTDAEMQKDEIVSSGKAKCPACGSKNAPSHEGESGRKLVTLCPSCKNKNVGNVKKAEESPWHPKGSGIKVLSPEEDRDAKYHAEMRSNHESRVAGIKAVAAQSKGVKKMDLPQSPEKASGGQLNKSDSLDALDVAQALAKTVVEKIASVREELLKMEQLEAAGNAKLQKNVGSLPSSTPSTKQIADGDANRHIEARNVFSLMQKGEGKFEPWKKGAKKPKAGKDKSGESVEGSGGLETVRPGPLASELSKQAMPTMKPPKAPSMKPAGIPGAKAGDAPKAPAAPKAAGAAGATMKSAPEGIRPEVKESMDRAIASYAGKDKKPAAPAPGVKKMDLPQSPEKAIGGQESSGSIPAVAKQAGGTTDAEVQKMDLPQSPEKAIGGQESSGSIPAVAKQAGGTTDAEMKKDMKPMSPSPVFGNKMGGAHVQPGGTFGAKSGVQVTTALPKLKSPAAAAMSVGAGTGHDMKTAVDTISNKTVSMKSPPMSKAELDSAKCPKCGDGMTLCKCSYKMK